MVIYHIAGEKRRRGKKSGLSSTIRPQTSSLPRFHNKTHFKMIKSGARSPSAKRQQRQGGGPVEKIVVERSKKVSIQDKPSMLHLC